VKKSRFELIFQSEEIIHGHLRQANEWIEYRGVLKVNESGKNRVSFDLSFVPPLPFVANMPERHSIRAESVTQAYVKLVRFLNEYGADLE
jgi:hypothetical protein